MPRHHPLKFATFIQLKSSFDFNLPHESQSQFIFVLNEKLRKLQHFRRKLRYYLSFFFVFIAIRSQLTQTDRL